MVKVILSFSGIIKNVGDEIMVVFGPPNAEQDHAERACLTALEMNRAFERIKKRWAEGGKVIFNAHIGINTGDMLFGRQILKQPSDYHVSGISVAVGANLSSAEVYKTATNILITEFTNNNLDDKLITRELDTVRVKGLTKSMVIFELVGENDIVVYPELFLAHYNEGIAHYKNQDWDRSLSEFKKALNFKEDELSKMYITRCMHFKKYSPGTEWDGVFVLRTW